MTSVGFEIALAVPVFFVALVVASYPLHAAILFWRQRRSIRRRRLTQPGRITILLPSRRLDSSVRSSIESLLGQALWPPPDLIVCVEDLDTEDQTWRRQRFASEDGQRIRFIMTGDPLGSLGKMHNLLAGVSEAKGDVLVLVDADARFSGPSHLARFVEPLGDPHIGLVSCFPAYRGARDIAAALSSLSINSELLGCFALVGVWVGLDVANGSCMAIRRDTLEQLGGLQWLKRQLLMDAALARAVRRAGYRVHLCEEPVAVHHPRSTYTGWWQQSHRWQVSMLRVLPRPAYFGFVCLRSALALAVGAVALSPSSYLALSALAAIALARVASMVLLNALYLRDPSFFRFVWLLPALDLLNAFASVWPLVDRRVWWGGRSYRVAEKGTAVPDEGS